MPANRLTSQRRQTDNLTGGAAVIDAAIESSSQHFGGKDLLEVAYAA